MDPQQPANDLEGLRAAFEPPAAEQYEGAPAASAAPDGTDAPPEQASEQVDYRALWEQAQQETAAERAERERLQMEQQQIVLRASQQAWEEERRRAHEYAKTLDFDQHDAYLANFYAQRENRLMEWSLTTTAQAAINEHAGKVIAYWGLDPQDRARLGHDPNQMNAIAESIVADRQRHGAEVETLRKELTQLRRQVNGNAALANPAYRQGGVRPGVATPSKFPTSSLEFLGERLGIPYGDPSRR